MKKTISVFLAIAVCLFLFAGCNREDRSLELSYQLQKRTASPGETISITVELKNVGKAFDYSASPLCTAYLYTEHNGVRYDVSPRASTPDGSYTYAGGENDRVVWPATLSFAKGETYEKTIEFEIPADMPTGAYSLSVDFEWASQTFHDVITVD